MTNPGVNHPVNDDDAAPESNAVTGVGADAGVEFREALTAAARRSGLGRVTPGEQPTAHALWGAVGGVRGLIEALLPGFLFLVVFTVTGEVAPSVLIPVGVAVLFVLIRAISRTPIMPAAVGLAGIALSAGLALWTGRAEENFLLGFVINSVWLLALVTSLLVRRPLIGVIVGLLTGDTQWRSDAAKRAVLTVVTWLWVALFAMRLGVQVPLYLAEQAGALAATKLVMGLPLYAAALWVTWLMVRATYPRRTQ
jgi:hypothetical protein